MVSIPANFVGILYVDIFAEGKNYTTASKRVTITVRPLAVKIRKVSNKAPRTLAFLWSKNGSVDGYQVQYSTTSKFTKSKKVLLKGSSVTKYSITGLTKGKTYYVRVRAYKTVNGTKIPSAWSTAVSAKIEK